MRRFLLLGLLCLLMPKLCAADDLLILAAVRPGHAARPSRTCARSIHRIDPERGSPETSQGVQVLPGKTYQISSWPNDFESEFDGIQGQGVVLTFAVLVLPMGHTQ